LGQKFGCPTSEAKQTLPKKCVFLHGRIRTGSEWWFSKNLRCVYGQSDDFQKIYGSRLDRIRFCRTRLAPI